MPPHVGESKPPNYWPLALSLWVAFQQQLAQLKAENAALLQAWEAEDAIRQSHLNVTAISDHPPRGHTV